MPSCFFLYWLSIVGRFPDDFFQLFSKNPKNTQNFFIFSPYFFKKNKNFFTFFHNSLTFNKLQMKKN